MVRTLSISLLAAGTIAALPLSYEGLIVIFGPPLLKHAIGFAGAWLEMFLTFALFGFGVVAIASAAQWIYRHPAAALCIAGCLVLLTAALS